MGLLRLLIVFLFFCLSLYAKINIAVSIEPENFLIKNIAKQKANVFVIVPKGASPHTYEPKPSTILSIQKADLYFAIGVEFEKNWLNRFFDKNNYSKIIHLDKNITKINNNPHIWLNINNLLKMSKIVYQALVLKDSANKNFYEKNFQYFQSYLKKCKKSLKEQLKYKKNKVFMVFHPAFTYFANEFGLKQIAIQVDGKDPSLKDILKIIKSAKENKIKTIITSPEFSDKAAKIIAKEINAKVVKISPLDENICGILNKIVQSLE